MPIPTHGPFCQTLIYPTSCWYCEQSIHVLQCSCGSAVLFDEIGPPWPKHACSNISGGIGGSGLSGWNAVDALRAQGAAISHDVMQKIFPARQSSKERKARPSEDIKRMEPTPRQAMDLLAVVRELRASTRRTMAIGGLSTMGLKLLGLDPKLRYWQITLVRNDVRPNESYTALVPEHLAQGLRKSVMVMVRMSARVRGNSAYWVVSDVNSL